MDMKKLCCDLVKHNANYKIDPLRFSTLENSEFSQTPLMLLPKNKQNKILQARCCHIMLDNTALIIYLTAPPLAYNHRGSSMNSMNSIVPLLAIGNGFSNIQGIIYVGDIKTNYYFPHEPMGQPYYGIPFPQHQLFRNPNGIAPIRSNPFTPGATLSNPIVIKESQTNPHLSEHVSNRNEPNFLARMASTTVPTATYSNWLDPVARTMNTDLTLGLGETGSEATNKGKRKMQEYDFFPKAVPGAMSSHSNMAVDNSGNREITAHPQVTEYEFFPPQSKARKVTEKDISGSGDVSTNLSLH